MSEIEETRIFINDATARALLDKCAAFDASQDERGKVNLTRSAILALRARLDAIAGTPEGKRWLREYDKAHMVNSDAVA